MEKLIGRTIGFLIALYLVSCIFGCQKSTITPQATPLYTPVQITENSPLSLQRQVTLLPQLVKVTNQVIVMVPVNFARMFKDSLFNGITALNIHDFSLSFITLKGQLPIKTVSMDYGVLYADKTIPDLGVYIFMPGSSFYPSAEYTEFYFNLME